MDNFTIHVGQKDFREDGSSIEQSFTNELGVWHVIAKRSGTCAVGAIFWKPNLNLSDEAFNFSPKIKLANSSSNLTYNATATKIPFVSCWNFGVYCEGFVRGYYTFEIFVEIDLSTVDLTCAVPSSIDHLREMYSTENLADVTIETNGPENIMVHNFVLSRSKVFDAMLNVHDMQEAQENVIKITDIDHDVLYEMFRYMYTDEVPMIKEMACKLLLAANKYDLQGLANECGKYLMKNVAAESFADVLVISDQLNLPNLKTAAIDFVIDNRKVIFSSDNWKQLKKNNMELAMEVLEKFVANA